MIKKIIRAAQNNKRIIIYGDADLDGVVATIILKETIETLNPKYKQSDLTIYFPDRENDGYGITLSGLDYLKRYAPAEFFALDCGISNFKELNIAKKLGFSVGIIDHHQILGKLPKADAIVDLFRPRETYPFKYFSTAGLVYKLIRPILNESQIKWQPEKFLDLVALATIADMMPQVGENSELIKQGLEAFKYSSRPGLKILKEITKVVDDDLGDICQKIMAPLNSSERIGHLTETYILLTTQSQREARMIAKGLIEKNKIKKRHIQEILEEIEIRIANQNSPIIYEASSNWPTVMIGVVASKLCQRYKKPVFLFKSGKTEIVGSCRPPKGFDGVKAMASCKKLFITYGGHPLACGCRLKNKNFQKARTALEKYFLKTKPKIV